MKKKDKMPKKPVKDDGMGFKARKDAKKMPKPMKKGKCS